MPARGPCGAAPGPSGPGALAGWSDDDLQAAFRAFRATADLLPEGWPRGADAVDGRAFLEQNFQTALPAEGLLTGYYEPELRGSATRTGLFCHALYEAPATLPVDRPWFSRAEIEDGDLLAGHEIVWLEDRLDAFLAQVQGSCRVRLDDGQTLRLGFGGKNGHSYSSIGQELVRRGALRAEAASVDRIRDWAARNPGDLEALLRTNASFVFFRGLALADDVGPIGSLGRPVTALRSLAVDPEHVTLGAPVWVEWNGAGRLMIAQDTGSAIRGAGRGDIFFGSGAAAGALAGAMKAAGRMTVLIPKGPRP